MNCADFIFCMLAVSAIAAMLALFFWGMGKIDKMYSSKLSQPIHIPQYAPPTPEEKAAEQEWQTEKFRRKERMEKFRQRRLAALAQASTEMERWEA